MYALEIKVTVYRFSFGVRSSVVGPCGLKSRVNCVLFSIEGRGFKMWVKGFR